MYHQMPEHGFLPSSHQRNREELDELGDLFNKKFQFRFNKDLKLPGADSWFTAAPWKVKELETLKERLNFHKSQLNDFNIEEWSSHTRRRNPAGEVGWKVKCTINPEFLTQAWTKFYECAHTYNIVPPEALTARKMVSLHLCEAPGAFIASLNHYLKSQLPNIEWKWVANTLNPYYEGNSPSNMISDDRFMFHTLDNWDFGEDNTGNLMDWNNSQSILRKATALGKVLLVTADGSIDCLSRPDDQEEVTSPLHYCEIITALQALSPGGTLVFKLFTVFEHSTVSLLFLINHLFGEVNIYKPVTSRQGNSEVYAVCLMFRGKAKLEPFLPILKSAYGTDVYRSKAMFPLLAIPQSFLKQVEDCALYFSSIQCHVINNNLQAYLMQNNITLHRDIKRIRAVVATEFISRYGLTRLEPEQEILKGSLPEENKINTNPRYHRGSYTERKLYTKMIMQEKCRYLNTFLQADALSNPLMLISEPVKWIFSEKVPLDLVFTYGCPVWKINSSKFIFVPIFKLYQQILTEPDFQGIILGKTVKTNSVNQKELGCDISKVLCLPEYDFVESYCVYEKQCFKMFFDTLKELAVGDTLLIQHYNMLTHFNVSLLYILTNQCFEKIGFTPCGSIVLNKLLDTDSLNHLDKIYSECEKMKADETKDVLNTLPVQITNCGEFYNNIVFYNNTFYRNKSMLYLAAANQYNM